MSFGPIQIQPVQNNIPWPPPTGQLFGVSVWYLNHLYKTFYLDISWAYFLYFRILSKVWPPLHPQRLQQRLVFQKFHILDPPCLKFVSTIYYSTLSEWITSCWHMISSYIQLLSRQVTIFTFKMACPQWILYNCMSMNSSKCVFTFHRALSLTYYNYSLEGHFLKKSVQNKSLVWFALVSEYCIMLTNCNFKTTEQELETDKQILMVLHTSPLELQTLNCNLVWSHLEAPLYQLIGGFFRRDSLSWWRVIRLVGHRLGYCFGTSVTLLKEEKLLLSISVQTIYIIHP